jgi:hypothetical protein
MNGVIHHIQHNHDGKKIAESSSDKPKSITRSHGALTSLYLWRECVQDSSEQMASETDCLKVCFVP